MRLVKSMIVALALLIALASILIVSPPVSATQNRPSWTEGDFWVYTRTQGSSTSTVRVDVHERTTLTLLSGTYNVFHITTTTTASNGNSLTIHSWVQDSNLGTAKTSITLPFFGNVQVTYDPPLAEAAFPLSVNAQWSLSTTLRIVNSTFTVAIPYSATVVAENTTTVAAGSFTVAVIQSQPSGSTSTNRDHYSEGAGNHVRRESVDGNGNRVSDQQLTSYHYQASTVGLLLIGIGIAIVAVIAIAVIVTMRRRRGRGPLQPPQAPPPP